MNAESRGKSGVYERDGALAALEALVERAGGGRGSVALVSGEAGIGKTTLLDAFQDSLDARVRVLRGGCDALFTPRPLGPILDMALQVGPQLRALLSAGAPSAQIYAGLLEWLAGDERPAVVIVEDAHWADHATLDLLKFLGRRIAFLGTVLVLSFRADEVTDGHPMLSLLGDLPTADTHRLHLEPLSPEGVARMAEQASMNPRELYEVTGGNPFFVTELLAGSGADGALVPSSVQDAVNARLMRLDPDVTAFLETLSVVPNPVTSALLEALFGTEADQWIHESVQRGLLLETGSGLRFRHELARLATLARLPLARRVRLHQRIADALISMDRMGVGGLSDQIVHHAAEGRSAQDVLTYGARAAANAASVGSHREAAAHLSTALTFVDDAEPEQAALLYERWAYEAGLALQVDEKVIEARRHAITLWRALGRMDKVGENLRWLSRAYWYRGESVESNRFADEAIRVLESTPVSEERAMAYSLRSQLHMLNDRMDESVEWGERALALAEELGSDDVKIHALNNVGTALLFRGNERGRAMLETSLQMAIERDQHEHAARVYTNLAEYGVEFRDFDLAERVLNEGLTFDSKHDLDAWTHYLIGRQAQLRLEQGRLEDAATIAAGVMKLERLTLLMHLPALIVLAKAHMRLGKADAADLLQRALEEAMATDELQYVVPVRLALVEFGWLNDDCARAEAQVSVLNDAGADAMHPWNLGELTVWNTRLTGTMPPTGLDVPEPYRLELEGKLSAAAAAWSALGVPHAAEVCRLQDVGSHTAAGLSGVMASAHDMGAGALMEKVRRVAHATGVAVKQPRRRRGHYGVARSHPLGLTRREQEVLAHMLNGENNVQISQALSRSRRTIEHHVSAVLQKLNVTSRMEAVLRVRNQPWLLDETVRAGGGSAR